MQSVRREVAVIVFRVVRSWLLVIMLALLAFLLAQAFGLHIGPIDTSYLP